MKNSLFTLLALVLAFASGALLMSLYPGDPRLEEPQAQPLYWVAPMDPAYRRDKPGKSPMGMDLVPVYAEPQAVAGDVNISPSVENKLGVKTAVVEKSVLSNEINTVGYVRFDEDRLHHIHVRVEGWIESLNVSAEGERVKAGELLFDLYSPTLFNAQKDLVSVLGSSDKRLINSARQRLRLQGMDAGQIEQVVETRTALERVGVFAPHSGIVSELNVRHGMYIEPSVEVMAIGSIDTVWVIAEVFERQSSWLKLGQLVSMAADSYPGEQWQGRVDYIYPVLNSEARTLQVRVEVDNRDQRLKPNMFTDLVIHAQATKPVLNIPRSALIRGGHGDRVVAALGDGRYRSVPVVAGREAAQRVEIISGLQDGERVVTSAQFLIDSESNITAESGRLNATVGAGESP